MHELSNSGARARKRWPMASITAALLGAVVLCQPNLASAAPHGGGGGFHGGGGFRGGGGFHAGAFGGFHGGRFHADAFRGGGFHGGVAGLQNGFGNGHGGHWYHGWHNGRYGWWLAGPGLAWTWWGSYPGYDYYDYGQPYAGQTW